MALFAMVLVYFSRRFINAFSWYLSLGVLLGVFSYYVISEDIRITIEELKLYKTQETHGDGIIDKIKLVLIRLLEI